MKVDQGGVSIGLLLRYPGCHTLVRHQKINGVQEARLLAEETGASKPAEPAWAAQLWGAAKAVRDAMGAPLPPIERADYERSMATACTRLGEKAFTAAWAEGRTMTPEQALTAQGTATKSIPATIGQPSTLPAKTAPTYPAGLTAREVEILRLVAQGKTDAQVADQLVISPRTVNWHLTSIYGKISVSSRAAATHYAMEQHLV